MKKTKFIYVYFIFLIIFIVGYFTNYSIKNISITDVVDRYLGVMIIPVLIFLFLYGIIFFTKNKIKREVREIRLYLFLMLLFLCVFLFILFKTGVNLTNFNKISIDDNFYRNFIENSLYKYKIGYFTTYLFYLLLKIKLEFRILLYIVLASLVLLTFLIIYAPIKNYIKKIILKHKEKKESLKRERLLQEQIKIKEALEKKLTRKEIKFKENKEKMMEEKVENFRKGIKLKKVVTLGDEKR